MRIYFESQLLKPALEEVCAALPGILGDDDTSHIKPLFLKGINQAQYICVIGNPQIAADLIFLNISGTDDNDDFGLFGKLHKHPQLTVRFEARQYTGSVEVIKKFSAELQVQLVPKLANTLADVFRLHGKVFLVVKSYFHWSFSCSVFR